jgi:hypothetical protein
MQTGSESEGYLGQPMNSDLECCDPAIKNTIIHLENLFGIERPLSPPTLPKADQPLPAKSRRRVTVRIKPDRQWCSGFSLKAAFASGCA